MGWGWSGFKDPKPELCDINAGLSKALAARGARPDEDWLIAQLNAIIAGMWPLIKTGLPVSMAYYNAYQQAQSLLKGLENGTLKSGPALNEQLKTLTENIEAALDCVPPPINISDQKPGPAVQPLSTPTSAPVEQPPPPPPIVSIAGSVAAGGGKDNSKNANAPFDAYTPLLPDVCYNAKQAIDMINQGGWESVAGFVHSSVTAPLKLAYDDAVSKGDTQLAAQLLDLLKVLEKFPTAGQIWGAVFANQWGKAKAEMLAQLQAIVAVACAEPLPLDAGLKPVAKIGKAPPAGVIVGGAVLLVAACVAGGIFGAPLLTGGGLPDLGDCPIGGCVTPSVEHQGTACGDFCDPDIADSCAGGLTCALLGYQGEGRPPRYTCWNSSTCDDGVHRPRECWSPCDGSASGGQQCNSGLNCALRGGPITGSFICYSITACGSADPLQGSRPTPTAASSGGQPVQPQGAGCACRGVDYICSNADGTVASVSYNATECGGSGQCDCREPDKALACPDGTFAPFNPACTGSGSCECKYSDPCAGGMSSCPGYYDTCSGAPCSP